MLKKNSCKLLYRIRFTYRKCWFGQPYKPVSGSAEIYIRGETS